MPPPPVSSLLPLQLPDTPHPHEWGRLHGSASALAIHEASRQHPGLCVVITPDTQGANQLLSALQFFGAETGEHTRAEVHLFPDWETLPYDRFSPHQDITSERIETLAKLHHLTHGILIVPMATLLQRLPPRAFVTQHSFSHQTGGRFDIEQMRQRLQSAGYRCVSQVSEHGEFAVRGALFDLFPMGANAPYRLDLFDDEIESIRLFDPETQRTLRSVDEINLLPAREFPCDDDAIKRFRNQYRARFEGDPQQSLIYREVSQGNLPGGIEYYGPLFFEQTATLFDYLPETTLLFEWDDCAGAAEAFLNSVKQRHEQLNVDRERPLLEPHEIYLRLDEWHSLRKGFRQVRIQSQIIAHPRGYQSNYATLVPPPLLIQHRAERPAHALESFRANFPGRILIVAESAGRRETLLELLRGWGIEPTQHTNFSAFMQHDSRLGITHAPLEQGLVIEAPALAIITEAQLMGARVAQMRRRQQGGRDLDAVVRNLTELQPGTPVVHEDHGVGRYIGLETLEVDGLATEFVTLEYAEGDRVYVPVAALHLISRYTGTDPDKAPLHRLGSDQWARARRKAAERVRDVAAELLEIYARRAAKQGMRFQLPEDEYLSFAAQFPFEETPDQTEAIHAILEDMASERPMDRVVCGDVGFGKTEVAMRAAFVAAQNGKQVAVLVPTTLLAKQHADNFRDRFADWPIRIEELSRFSGGKQQTQTLAALASGQVDMVIGTHKLLQESIKFKRLGLVIVDEEHRFGVRHKEHLKRLRAEADILTLTATPIPRTLNMAMSGIRDLSIIATPPVRRLAVKTFVSEWNDGLIIEACQRELKRGGQIYFLHNEVSTIEKTVVRLRELIPEARVEFAHGQMRESELEQVMSDFYHQRFNILVCSTIIESGIDIPSANTIIINRADKLGLAQLHQLRGRVGRSHHRAYAYLIAPAKRTLSDAALKRLEAIESLEDLGAGFLLASNDLEIRGAGELLGEEQSGQIQEVGYTLYSEMLERAVKALKQGEHLDLDQPMERGPTVELRIPSLIPEDYLPDVQQRLILYKRIANAANRAELRELQVEMIDRFGLLPEAVKNLFAITQIKLDAERIGVRKIEAGPSGGRLVFIAKPKVDPVQIIQLIQTQPQTYRLDGSEKLRFALELESPERRISAIEELLKQLEVTESAA